MKTLKASNLGQAQKQLSEIDKSLAEKLNENVKDVDKKHYHVILVKVVDRPGQPKNDVSMIIQTYNKQGYEKLKKNFIFQGFTQAILLHEPVADEDVVIENVSDEKDAIIAGKDAEIEALKAKLASVPNQTTQPEPETTTQPVESQNQEDVFDVLTADFKGLNVFASENNIDLQGKRSTEDIRVVVDNWIKSKA